MKHALLLAFGCLFGCSVEPGIELNRWSLTSGQESVEVQVPAHLPVTPEVQTYRLTTVVQTTDAAQRCLLLPWLLAETEARFDDVTVPSFTGAARPTYRAQGPHLFCASQLTPGSHEISLEVRHTWTQSNWLEGTPRLVTQEAGQRELGWRTRLTFWTYVSAASSTCGVSLTYALMFFLARRRRDFGWFAMQAGGACIYPLFTAGFTQGVGTLDYSLMASTLTVACISSVYFTHEVFKLGPVPKLFPLLLTASILGACFFSSPFEGIAASGGAVVSVEVVVVYQLVQLTKLSLKRSMNAALFLCAWVLLGAFAFIDLNVFLGLAPWAGGLRLAGIGLTIFALLQVVGLSREFLNTLIASETRATVLEAQQLEMQRLNTELKFQIAQRSKALAAALSKLGAAAGTLEHGAVVDSRYRVNGFIGAGAMGRVYNVTRVTDEHEFAMKVMSDAQTGSGAIRFVREAEILCNLTHENVVGVVDAGVDERGLLFLVLELVSGFSLEERERLVDTGFGLEVIRQVAEGLAGLHAANIIHRDLKPGNILLAREANGVRVKLTDFGISSFGTDAPANPKPETGDSWLSQLGGAADDKLTQAGTVLGTPAYIAPEVSVSASAGKQAAADVFSLGVIACELLTGKRPWEEPAIVLKLKGIAPPTFDLAVACPSLTVEVAQVLTRALSWEASQRPTAAEIAARITPRRVEMPPRVAVSPGESTRKDSATSLL